MNKLNQKIDAVREKVGKIAKDKENPYFKSKYFDVNSLLDVLLPALKEEGLSLIQPLSNIGGKPSIRTIVSDGNEEIVSEVPLPENQDPQKMGSIITYFRRYALQSLFCLQAEDDDGNVASGKLVGGSSPQNPRDDF